MANKGIVASALLICISSLPLWGGTGRPSDGFLSFILLFGFLGFLLGILQLGYYMKRKIREFQEDIF